MFETHPNWETVDGRFPRPDLLREGDHLAVDRGFYTHHGIVTGVASVGEPTIAHYAGSDFGGEIKSTPLSSFVQGSRRVFLVLERDTGLLEPAEVVHRATALVGHARYFLTDHNCEHWSSWCSTGVWRSHQVEAAVDAVGSAGYVDLLGGAVQVARWGLTSIGRWLAKPDKVPTECPSCADHHPFTWVADGSSPYLQVLVDRLRDLEGAA